jgi:hypothetical protein
MYTSDQVKLLLRQFPHDLHGLARGIGSGAISPHGYHEAGVSFWTAAIALTGDGMLNARDRAFAESELVRHTEALK